MWSRIKKQKGCVVVSLKVSLGVNQTGMLNAKRFSKFVWTMCRQHFSWK